MSLKKVLFVRLFYLVAGLLMYSAVSQVAYAHGMSEADKLAIIEGGNLRYMWLGATHMLSGYDHLLFVFGIIFFLSTFRDIAKYVTAFTLGHSVTLIYATFNAIQVNYFLIDAVIGLSVCYIAFSNINGFRKYLNINPPNMIFMITGLGFIHGFGLSTRLQELPLSEDNLLLNIISFNVGIELGQISALALMLLLVAAWRKRQTFQVFSVIANYGLMAAGILLFLMQMHGYDHASNLEEFVANSPPIQMVDNNEIVTEKLTEKVKLHQQTDVIRITIPARGDKEYKLYLAEGSIIEYTWKTEGAALFYDLHGEPEGDVSGYFKSFKKSTASGDGGTLTSSFRGTHGWYWKNSTPLAATITLEIEGEYQRLDLEAGSNDIKSIENTIQTTHDTL